MVSATVTTAEAAEDKSSWSSSRAASSRTFWVWFKGSWRSFIALLKSIFISLSLSRSCYLLFSLRRNKEEGKRESWKKETKGFGFWRVLGTISEPSTWGSFGKQDFNAYACHCNLHERYSCFNVPAIINNDILKKIKNKYSWRYLIDIKFHRFGYVLFISYVFNFHCIKEPNFKILVWWPPLWQYEKINGQIKLSRHWFSS